MRNQVSKSTEMSTRIDFRLSGNIRKNDTVSILHKNIDMAYKIDITQFVT